MPSSVSTVRSLCLCSCADRTSLSSSRWNSLSSQDVARAGWVHDARRPSPPSATTAQKRTAGRQRPSHTAAASADRLTPSSTRRDASERTSACAEAPCCSSSRTQSQCAPSAACCSAERSPTSTSSSETTCPDWSSTSSTEASPRAAARCSGRAPERSDWLMFAPLCTSSCTTSADPPPAIARCSALPDVPSMPPLTPGWQLDMHLELLAVRRARARRSAARSLLTIACDTSRFWKLATGQQRNGAHAARQRAASECCRLHSEARARWQSPSVRDGVRSPTDAP
mmetsp:Transcript_15650/g.52678  ORF Transcript_15650/g.52678 Transcript_15650/m.52678 type:complete len:284 (-) Transcript_15650:83-934(-)